MTEAGKKILFLGSCNSGGLAHYAHEWCLNITRLGHRVTLVSLGPFEVPAPLRNYDLIEVQRAKATNKAAKGLSNLKFALAALRIARHDRPDAIFLNAYQPYMAWPFAAFRPRHIPLFCIQHEVEPRVGDLRIGWFQRDFYRKTTAMIVHRHTHSRHLLVNKYKVSTPVVSIDFGLYETDLFGRETAQVKDVKTSILSFGTVREDKGLDILVKAYPGREKCKGLRLVIAGQAKGDYEPYFGKVVANQDGVSWDNRYIPSTQVGELYREAAFVVLPFTECTQSGSLRLAMFFETPIIASAVGELPTFIEEHQVGILVPAGDVGALREAISTLANDPARRAQYVENIRRLNGSQALSWRNIVQQLLLELKEQRLW